MTFTAEQDALRDSVRKLLDREAEPWPELCEQIGVAALAVPERFGGLGAGTTEMQVVAEELGRVLADVPFLGSAVLAVHAVLATGDSEACERLLPRFAEGVVGAVAWADADGRWSVPACHVTESTVDGEAHYVLNGDEAEIMLVMADGSLYEVSDFRAVRTPAMDETRRLARVAFDHSPARLLGPVDLTALRDVACAVLAAEQAGAAARAFELTVEYSRQRHQFGRPIGGFQALKHRMADLHVLVETARSAAYAAPESSRLAAVAKVHCSEALATVAGEMIQLHGGIAITWEHPAHRYFKRAHGATWLFGSPGEHLGRVRPPLS
ncbi:acyl-CoA dehydrogenase family protein [Amycolatopsis regifaucium]|uniref:Acyl-CoA dehydrogenase n=1 Tax=Amycolatopsis regifaucium TaxID=546365 RepID=A0A154MJD2_9PSEU|nr:acyl-CoA dehydrogenase family protein [Amycolatopsis regifaucium]KZB84445.1 acyl-CoA dehydrogenase [Amycolatopsis regifaucium]OKA10908.1 acyl-CoA dehydrogenase [Amycolatopsis regifaucium]SFI21638.1 Acyl-CoA dehydrogenase [Amycolatopsis regifaucium]